MQDQDKSKQALIEELAEMRRRVAVLETADTNRKQAEAALRESEERYRLLSEAIPHPVWRSDAEGRQIDCNHRWQEYTGQTPEEAQGNGWMQALHPDDVAWAVQRKREDVAGGELYEAEYRLRRASDNSYHWYLARAIPRRDANGTILGWFGCAMDIDGQKQVEEALAEREARLLEAQEVANLGFQVIDLATGNITTSPGLDRIFGIPLDYKRTLDEWAELIHPDDRQEIRDYFKEVVAERKPFDREHRIVRYGDKQVRWIHGLGRLHFNDDGQPVSMLGTVQDITERKQAEEALRESEERFRKVFEEGPIGILLVGTDGRIRHANQYLCDRLGYSENEVIALGLPGISQPDDWERDYPFVSRLWRGEIAYYHAEKRYLRKDGQAVWCQLTVSLMHDEAGRPINTVGMVEDITERKQAEETLRASEAKYRRLHQTMMDAFVRVDMNGFIQECNDTFGKMLGYDTEELRKFRYMDLTQEKWNSYVEEIVQNQIVPRGYSDVYEKEYRRKDGTIVPIEMRVSLITDNKNQPSGMWAIVRDITERKRAEEALQKAKDELEQRVRERTAELAKANEDLDIFRKFVEASNQGFSMADLDNHLTYLNPALCHMLGEEGPDNALGKHLSIYYSEESNRRGQEEIEPALMRAGYWQGELPMLSRQGKSIPTWQNAFVIRDRQGSPLRFAVVITDMTERKQAEATLRQSHDELRAIYDGMVDGMLVVDIETKRFFTANAAMARMLGYSETELRSLAVKDIHPPADLPFVVEQFQGLAEGRIEVSEDVPVLRKDGSVFYAMVTSSKVTYDDRPCIVGFFRDVTERRRAEEALRQSEERYELAVRGAGVGIWDWDIRTGKVYYSARWKMLFGYDENDIGGSVDDWATLLHPDERDWILKFQEDFLAGPLSTVSVEYRLRHKDGSYRWIVAHGLAVRDEQGRAYRFVGSHGDITDRKHAEEALAKERQSLWRMLQASDHERQIISYEIHDGLAQYLAAARMQFQAYDSLKENLPNEAAKAYDTAVELVRQAYAESRRLINEVRPPVIDEIGLETAISHLVHEQRKRGGPKIECQSNVQFGKLPSILENALYRIAQEALTNACKHSKSIKVTVTLVQEGQDVRLEVRDWGIGFDTKSVKEGHFGLEGIRQRVRLLGGRLTIESKPDSGTLLQVIVPILEKPTAS